jgi:O-6-methylguanine DNA methyltransferase
MKAKTSEPFTFLPVATAWGNFTAGYTDRGLAALNFPPESASKPCATRAEAGTPTEIRRWHALTTKAVQAALAGKPLSPLPPLDLTIGTPFQQSVWRALQEIAAGKTKSYGEIAAAVGRPKASRAVGAACGANPIPVLIPCHRVLAAGGGLGGFTAGLDWKRRLLSAEGC